MLPVSGSRRYSRGHLEASNTCSPRFDAMLFCIIMFTMSSCHSVIEFLAVLHREVVRVCVRGHWNDILRSSFVGSEASIGVLLVDHRDVESLARRGNTTRGSLASSI